MCVPEILHKNKLQVWMECIGVLMWYLPFQSSLNNLSSMICFRLLRIAIIGDKCMRRAHAQRHYERKDARKTYLQLSVFVHVSAHTYSQTRINWCWINCHVSDLLWTAPELLSVDNRALPGTPAGDVYAFGIILQEIICREGPFYVHDMELEAHGENCVRLLFCQGSNVY